MRRLSFRRKEARNDAVNERRSRNYSWISLAIDREPETVWQERPTNYLPTKIISCRSLLEIVAKV